MVDNFKDFMDDPINSCFFTVNFTGRNKTLLVDEFNQLSANLCDPKVSLHDQDNTLETVCLRVSGLKGLTIQPVAPAALPSAFLSPADSVVNSKIGVNL